MSLKIFMVLCLVSFGVCDESAKKPDSEVSGADFVPQFQSFQFPIQPVFGGPSDLTALQQTHVLGNFHHRFHPTRQNTQFAVNGAPSAVLPPQSHIVPPQPTAVQDQRNILLQPQLIPPQPAPSHHEILRPPNPQPDTLVPPQPPVNSQHTFKTFPTQKPQNPFSPANDQSIKNSFPSNAPHTIKFSISSTNYNPNQVKNFVNSPAQQPKINHQVTSNFQQGRFVSPPQVHQNRPVFNQQANGNFQQQNTFSDAAKIQQTSFQGFNSFPKKPEIVPQQNSNFQVQTQQSFSPSPIPSSVDLTSQFQVNGNIRPNDITGNAFGDKTIHPARGNSNFDIRQPEPQIKFTQSPSFEIRPGDLQQQTQFNQQPFAQPNFEYSQLQSQQNNLNLLQPTVQTQFQFNLPEQQVKFNIQPSVQPNVEFRSTSPPKTNPPEIYSGRTQETNKVSSTVPQPVPTFSSKKEIFFQKSQEQPQYTLTENFSQATPNDINPATPSPTTPQTYTTVSETIYRKPKPIVKEITINLNDQKLSEDGIPSQLYIKENREKEFLELKQQEERAKQKGKNEKSQEDVINEQIQKLLQSHNLEIIDKDNDSGSESQEAQLTQFSEQFKKKYNYSVQLLNGGSLLRDLKPKKKLLTTLPPLPELPEHIKKQYDIKLVHKDDLFKQFDLPENHKLGNDSNVFLANGQQLEVVKFTKDGLMNKVTIGSKTGGLTTTNKPPKELFEELTKGVIPPGADFELIKHKGDGEVEKVTDLNPSKKVTFVFLEEQPDGSVKVQGVKGNTNQETEQSDTVDSLIKKIKDGSLKLPPSKQKSLLTNEIPRINPVSDKTFVTFPPSIASSPTPRSIKNYPPTLLPHFGQKDASEPGPTTEYSIRSSPYAVDIDATITPTSFYETTPEATTFLPTVNYVRSSTRKTKTRNRVTFLPTVPTVESTFTPTFASRRIKATTSKPVVGLFKNFVSSRKSKYTKTPHHYEEQDYDSEILSHKSTEYSGQRLRVPQDVVGEESNIETVRPLKDILIENDLKEMAKFLDQSGLDTILNETGPYTIFIPTDKAFRTLEDQLGGADKAEDKFRENPRLLSGLLLHHVVPGSFRLEDLQDEMTGVSLAGTQLRVNTYTPEDKSTGEEKVVTINGAQISNRRRDINVPQGLAHAIDRVLFPLPVGDIVQTLRGDRERRFTKFLKSLESSGLTDMLTGTKTYTVFAPTDKAFSVLTDAELDKLLTRREAAKTIVLRHVVPGTLYSAGMNYFQVKESMESGQKIVIKKELGKIKANSAQLISANIPATNGVVHAVESLL